MIDLLTFSVISYIITLILVANPHLAGIRAYVKGKTQWFGSFHPVDCRLCIGFWVSLVVCFWYTRLDLTLVVYGLSYFMAVQERR